MIRLHTRIPPPVVTLAVAGIMWLVAFATPGLVVSFAGQGRLAAAIAIAGVALMAFSIFKFTRARTTVNPLKPTTATALVTSGVFALTRNPIYLADLIFLIALATWLGSICAFALAPVLVWYLNVFQIAPEEEALASLFGEEYRSYCARVRRWI